MRFTEEQLIDIENAYEELLIIMREQERDYGVSQCFGRGCIYSRS